MGIDMFRVHFPGTIDAPLLATLHSGQITQGKKVDEFEAALRDRLDMDVVTVNSGTAALELALRLLDLKPGDEVITTPMTCSATALAIVHAGGTIVWADVNPYTGLIDPVDVGRKVSDRTRAVVPVEWGGTPCDYHAIALATPPGTAIIVDAAHAFGRDMGGQRDTMVDAFCFSFQAIKHITTVDGGAIAFPFPTEGLVDRAKRLRWFGIDRTEKRSDARIEADILEAGFKWHMNDVAATIGIEQLRYIDQIIELHRKNADHFARNLAGYFGMAIANPEESACWLYTLTLDDADTRDRFAAHMKDRDIAVSRVHGRLDKHTCFAGAHGGEYLPGTDDFNDTAICIPVHWALKAVELDTIVKACNEFAAIEMSHLAHAARC